MTMHMRKPRSLGRRALPLLGMLAVTLCSQFSSAHASLSVSASVGGAPSGVKYVNFDDLALGSAGGVTVGPNGSVVVSFSGDAQVVTGSQGGVYAAPFISGGNSVPFNPPGLPDGPDPTKYLTTGTGTVTIDFGGPQAYVGLLWGSVDDYNSLDFYDGATYVGTITGSQVKASPNGDQGVNGTLYVNITSTDAFTKIVARSTSNAFEFDNVSYNVTAPVPEPSTVVIGLVGGSLLGLYGLRRKRAAV